MTDDSDGFYAWMNSKPLTDQELVYRYVYWQAIQKNDLKEMEVIEGMIARDLPVSSPVHIMALRNVSARMTPSDWQSALGAVCENIIATPPISEDK